MHDKLYSMITWNGGHLEKYDHHFEFHMANGIF